MEGLYLVVCKGRNIEGHKDMLEEGEDQVKNPGGRRISVDGGSVEKNREGNCEAGTWATQEVGR